MKRRGFLGALAAIVAAPKVLERLEPEISDLEYTPRIWQGDDWDLRHDENPAKEPVTTCPNCGRFRTKASSRILVMPPSSGVGFLSESDYLPMPSMPELKDGCLRCLDE